MFVLSLLSFAHAQARAAMDIACDPASVVDTIPAAQQEGVALDVQPVAIVENVCGGSDYLLELFRDGDEEPVASSLVIWGWDPPTTSLRLVPETPLEPDTAYIFRITPQDGWSESSEIGFTTGDALVRGAAESPEVVTGSALVDESWSWVNMTVQVRPAEDPDELSIVQLVDPADPERVFDSAYADAGQRVFLNASWSEDFPANQDICIDVVQVDGAGNPGEPQRWCVTPDIDRGTMGRPCSAVGAGASGWLAMLGLVALLRRKD